MRKKTFFQLLDSLILVVVFLLAVQLARFQAGLFPAHLIPGIRDLLLLLPLGLAWHLAARASGLYGEFPGPARAMTVLLTSVLCQFLLLAFVLFFLRPPALDRFFAVRYSAGLLALTALARWAGRAWGREPRLPAKRWIAAAGGVALLAAAMILLLSPGKPPRPVVVLISIDTLRADRLGCYGCPTATSPNIDAFSRDSVQFMQAFSQAPSTTSSHMSLFTGLLPPVHRVTNWAILPNCVNHYELSGRLGKGIPTLALYLKENGYRTIGMHDGGHVSANFGFDRGFDVYSDQEIKWSRFNSDSASQDKLRSLLRRGDTDPKPLFLFLHHYICHDPYIKAPAWVRRKFLPNPAPGLPLEPGQNVTNPNWLDLRDNFWKAIDGGNPAHRSHVRALYDAGVNYADLVFGRVIDTLKKEGVYDQALIAVVSDHGEEFWEHGHTLHHYLFVETLHVPLLVKFPKQKYGGRKISALVGQFDLMPTILEYLRILPRQKIQAESLLPLIRDAKSPRGRVLSFDDGLNYVRFNRDDYVYSNQGILGINGEWLYNRITDAREEHNLAAVNIPLKTQLRALAAKIMHEQKFFRAGIQSGSREAPKLSEELVQQLKALGYL